MDKMKRTNDNCQNNCSPKKPRNQRNIKSKKETNTGQTRNWETEITTENGFLAVHSSKGTPRVIFIDLISFNSYRYHSKRKLFDYIKNRESQNFSQV